ncbi:MAG: flavodoxin family protein [Roseiflexus sp.]
MRVLIIYVSWFGHNRSIARMIADQLSSRFPHVICAPVTAVTAGDTIGCDLLVLGSFTHAHHAGRCLRHLVETIPERRCKRMAVAVFGTQTVDERPSGVDELVRTLAKRGARPIVPPLRIILPVPDFVPWSRITSTERAKIDAFVKSLTDRQKPDIRAQQEILPWSQR